MSIKYAATTMQPSVIQMLDATEVRDLSLQGVISKVVSREEYEANCSERGVTPEAEPEQDNGKGDGGTISADADAAKKAEEDAAKIENDPLADAIADQQDADKSDDADADDKPAEQTDDSNEADKKPARGRRQNS